METKRWAGPVLAVLLVAVAVGWGAVSRSDDGSGDGGTVDSAVRNQAPDRSRFTSPDPDSTDPGPSNPSNPSSSARAPSTPQDVLYLGDSLAMEAQDVLGGHLERSARVGSYSSEPVAGVTVCDYIQGRPGRSLVPPEDKAAALVEEREPGVIVLQFWGNTWGYTPCMEGVEWGTPEYYERYAADLRALTRQIASAARAADVPRPRLVWVQQPPDALHPERIEQVNDLYEEQAAASGDLLADGGRELRDGDGKWTQYLPCNDDEQRTAGSCTGPDGTVQLHREDDPLHFCLAPTPEGGRPCPVESPGLERYSRAVAEEVDAYLGG
ncbi:SGNH/GDSL hydrolase family protein [Streptomyces sp. WMMC500]|uniref:SGNH/GDSL hydrolase family protein n=1 Tax=Streptomyces sp. WMMC500 TaxID=3015154 RepID=UPI00248AF0B7|nr:SGNH/GDSL hydrolase family protein [Streptomyces sp. WMMC500]WBB59637.1 SGNH/GDSL hydrolase family protein [Streptomyces sp. WMMC500]